MKKAYENWSQVVEYDGKTLMSFKNKKARNELPMGQVDYSNSLNNQLQQPRLPAPVQSEPSALDPGMLIGGMQQFNNKFFMSCL